MRAASVATSACGSRTVGNEITPVSGLPTRSASIDERLAGADVGRDDGAPARIDVEEGRLAAADRLAGGAFEDQPPLEQVVDDERDDAAAHAHGARQVGARDGLVQTHQIEHDLAVDFARGGAGGDAEPRRVDSAHASLFVLRWDKLRL